MLKSALKNIKKFNLKTKVLGVTLLTSLDGKDSKKIYREKDTDKLIKKLSLIASKAKIAGLICSGHLFFYLYLILPFLFLYLQI